jgi:NADH dehydrogenase
MKNVLITGATGFVGSNLVEELSKKRYVRLRCILKNDEVYSFSSKNIDIMGGSLENSLFLEKATKGINIVIHLAAVINSKKISDFYKVNVEYTKNLLNSCKKNKVKKIIFFSTIDAILPLRGLYGESKLRAENLIKGSGLNFIILRPSVIYGKNDRKNLSQLVDKIKDHKFIPIIGNGNYKRNPIYISDVLNVITRCIESDKFNNNTYELGGPTVVSYKKIVDLICIKLNLKRYKIYIPSLFLKFVSFLKPLLVFLNLPFEQIANINCNKVANPHSINKFGLKPTSLNRGLDLILDNYESKK